MQCMLSRRDSGRLCQALSTLTTEAHAGLARLHRRGKKFRVLPALDTESGVGFVAIVAGRAGHSSSHGAPLHKRPYSVAEYYTI